MSWITENKGRGPWEVEPITDKVIYNEGDRISSISNPVWDVNHEFSGVPVTGKHVPCGYWFSTTQSQPEPEPEVESGKLYAGTNIGTLVRWNGADAWEEVAPQLNGQIYIRSLAVYNGKLYAGTGRGGRLFQWNGVSAWEEVAPQLNDQTYIRSLAAYNGRLYGGTEPNGLLFEWNGVDAWEEVASQYDSKCIGIASLLVYNNKLYGGELHDGDFGHKVATARLFEWNGVDAWEMKAGYVHGYNDDCLSLTEYQGYVFGGTAADASHGGALLRWDGVSPDWVRVAYRYYKGDTDSVLAYNDVVYGTVSGRLWKWNGVNAWIEVAPIYGSNTRVYLVIYEGRLFGGGDKGDLLRWNDVDAWEEMAHSFDNIFCVAVYRR